MDVKSRAEFLRQERAQLDAQQKLAEQAALSEVRQSFAGRRRQISSELSKIVRLERKQKLQAFLLSHLAALREGYEAKGSIKRTYETRLERFSDFPGGLQGVASLRIYVGRDRCHIVICMRRHLKSDNKIKILLIQNVTPEEAFQTLQERFEAGTLVRLAGRKLP